MRLMMCCSSCPQEVAVLLHIALWWLHLHKHNLLLSLINACMERFYNQDIAKCVSISIFKCDLYSIAESKHVNLLAKFWCGITTQWALLFLASDVLVLHYYSTGHIFVPASTCCKPVLSDCWLFSCYPAKGLCVIWLSKHISHIRRGT